MRNPKDNVFERLIEYFKGLFSKKKKTKKRSKSKGITIIPNRLLEVQKPLYNNFDKVKFYRELKRKFPRRYRTIYRMMALETRHFKSKQFVYTGTGGMEVHKEAFPYGWTIGKKLWEQDKYAPFGYKIFTDGANRRRAFLSFKSPIAFAAVFNKYLGKYRAGRWRSTNPEKAASYEKILKTIRLPKI